MGDQSIKDAAALMGCSTDTIYRALADGEFPNAYRLLGAGPWRIPRADIECAKDRWREKTHASA
jgi:excisionase family DNA binding protein